jgi:hypothetical protein
MNVIVEEINQVLVLRTGQMESRLTFRLPNGTKISAVVSEEDLELFLRAQPREVMSQTPQNDLPEVETDEAPAVAQADLVTWADLRDEYLSADMKAILTSLGAAPAMPMADLVSLVREIAQNKQLMGEVSQAPAQPAVPAPQQAAPQPAAGQVMMRRSPPRRTVPKDEFGYPIVPGVGHDPGEVGVPDADEDGVGQL